jgi:hypothetical protein
MRKILLSGGRSLLMCLFTRRAIKLTVVIIGGYHYYQLHKGKKGEAIRVTGRGGP